MSRRELVVLGTASMVPTRTRNHNGYVLFWDDEAILFDPGEGTQRQMTFAGVSATDVTRVAITHLHGDHSLGLAGVAQRISGDGVQHTIPVSYPASGQRWVDHLLDASAHHRRSHLLEQPLTTDGTIPPSPDRPDPGFTLSHRRLDHTLEAVGYRLDEPDGRSLDPTLLARHGLAGPVVGQLQRDGVVTAPDGRTVTLDDVSAPRPGQSFAFVMDTRLCDAVLELAEGVDLLVIESTFLDRDLDQAERWGHLTAFQAAKVAAEAGVRHLVLTHFSQRYTDPREFEREARAVFDGDLTVAQDLDRVPVPRRRSAHQRGVDQPGVDQPGVHRHDDASRPVGTDEPGGPSS
ncbi:ribonuclease Z [Cellulosimicrobium sp. Marseille-Q4280]|uniref:ribonuclease Z n=1 Tax=Cellulosimicrobium sp. Marseille-Q4280 TaxID=2937992 RepID=UPI00203E8139|nr:ribonuclease Z [Cellulosimicrobium sp. Marseille-Q4280]